MKKDKSLFAIFFFVISGTSTTKMILTNFLLRRTISMIIGLEKKMSNISFSWYVITYHYNCKRMTVASISICAFQSHLFLSPLRSLRRHSPPQTSNVIRTDRVRKWRRMKWVSESERKWAKSMCIWYCIINMLIARALILVPIEREKKIKNIRINNTLQVAIIR